MKLQEIELELNDIKDEIKEKQQKHERFINTAKLRINELNRLKTMNLNGIDNEKVKIAESTLDVYGLGRTFNERCVNEAIKDIAQGVIKLEKRYFGVKNYECFTHQECDCDYGYGPRHGSVVFRVGLKKPREKLTDEQIECCLYYLNLLLNSEARKTLIGEIK